MKDFLSITKIFFHNKWKEILMFVCVIPEFLWYIIKELFNFFGPILIAICLYFLILGMGYGIGYLFYITGNAQYEKIMDVGMGYLTYLFVVSFVTFWLVGWIGSNIRLAIKQHKENKGC